MYASIPVLIFLSFTWTTDSARILGIFPFPSRSHYILGSALMRALTEQGHDVTVISAFEEKQPPRGGQYREIRFSEMMKHYEKHKRNETVNYFEIGEMNPLFSDLLIATLMADFGEISLKEPVVQELVNSGEKFDAVIIEQFFSDAHKPLAAHFDAVQIVFSTVGANFWVNTLVGNPSPLSYVPTLFAGYPMTFNERLTNILVYLLNVGIYYLYLYPKYAEAAQRYIPTTHNFYDVLHNTSLVLLNSHTSVNQPVPHVPNMVEIGGFHVKPPKKLPQDLQKFVDDAKDGVIYFSLGSNIASAGFPVEKLNAILRTFSKLKQKVLWKWDDISLSAPKNVRVEKWLPQQDILAHPNVKLFITHGGLLSITETVYHGVPVLVIPIFGDQNMNAQTVNINGFGLLLPFRDLNEETLTTSLKELLTTPKYVNNAKKASELFHDREVKPMDTALYWINYVIRHQGAPHLRVAAIDLPWYRYLLLDVIVVLAVGTFLGSSLIWVLARKVYRRLCPKKNKVKKN